MLFNSFEYFLFLPIVLIIYFSLPFNYRVWFLLLASYVFYMFWRWQYVAIIILQTEINYVAGKYIGKSENKRGKLFWLIISNYMHSKYSIFLQVLQFSQRYYQSCDILYGGRLSCA